jgi:hypothetical protein
MSFTDMMSSSRGPGVIGTVMALIVLVGFGILFLFAFDERLQGGEMTIEAAIAAQEREIDSMRRSIAHHEKELAKSPALLAAARELTGIKRENQFRDGKLGSLTSGINAANETIAAKTAEFEAYKEQYRAFARGKAKGRTIPRLQTRKGDVYQNVTLREVTPIGIQILHDDGQKRIAFEELPAEMQDEFQFDPKQKAAAVAREAAVRDEHEAAVSVANAEQDRQMAELRRKEAADNRAKMQRSIAVMESRVESLTREIEELEQALPKEALKKLSRAPQMRGQLANKQRESAKLQAEIARLRASL